MRWHIKWCMPDLLHTVHCEFRCVVWASLQDDDESWNVTLGRGAAEPYCRSQRCGVQRLAPVIHSQPCMRLRLSQPVEYCSRVHNSLVYKCTSTELGTLSEATTIFVPYVWNEIKIVKNLDFFSKITIVSNIQNNYAAIRPSVPLSRSSVLTATTTCRNVHVTSVEDVSRLQC